MVITNLFYCFASVNFSVLLSASLHKEIFFILLSASFDKEISLDLLSEVFVISALAGSNSPSLLLPLAIQGAHEELGLHHEGRQQPQGVVLAHHQA